jgi:hypothetical protein
VVYFYFGADDQGWSSFTSALTVLLAEGPSLISNRRSGGAYSRWSISVSALPNESRATHAVRAFVGIVDAHVLLSVRKSPRAAGVHNNGAVISALRPCIHTREPIVEKTGSRYRIRSRYLRLWLATRHQPIPKLIPLLRPERACAAALRTVCPQLLEDLES